MRIRVCAVALLALVASLAAVLVPATGNANAQQAEAVAEKLRRLVEAWQFPGVPRTITISAGVAAFPVHGRTRDEMVRAADCGLYAAKQAGRNRVCVATVALAATRSN